MYTVVADSLDLLTLGVWSLILSKGTSVSPRGIPCKELMAPTLVLNNPLNRLCTVSNRGWSMEYAGGELAWYLSGSSFLSFIEYYAPSYGRFSDDGNWLYGAYGPRIFVGKYDDAIQWSPWEKAFQKLWQDMSTRQAVIPIFEAEDIDVETKDLPCTLSLQFMIRDQKLDLLVNMRSNDAWLGLPYDIFCFTVFQELMAAKLGVEIGRYYHHVGSLHLYDKNIEGVREALRSPNPYIALPNMPTSVLSRNDKTWVNFLLACEEELRLKPWGEYIKSTISEYVSNVPDLMSDCDIAQLLRAAWAWKRLCREREADVNLVKMTSAQLEMKLGSVFKRCFTSMEKVTR